MIYQPALQRKAWFCIAGGAASLLSLLIIVPAAVIASLITEQGIVVTQVLMGLAAMMCGVAIVCFVQAAHFHNQARQAPSQEQSVPSRITRGLAYYRMSSIFFGFSLLCIIIDMLKGANEFGWVSFGRDTSIWQTWFLILLGLGLLCWMIGAILSLKKNAQLSE